MMRARKPTAKSSLTVRTAVVTDVQVKSRGDPRAELVWHPWSCSLAIWNEEGLLDIPFSVEEVKRVVGKLMKGKAAGPDSILVYSHFTYSQIAYSHFAY